MIQAILFDKDGTLFDFSLSWSNWTVKFLRGLSGGDEPWAERLGSRIGFDLSAREFAQDSIAVAGTDTDIVEALLPELPHLTADRLLTVIHEATTEAEMQEVVPLAPFLSGLRARGQKLGVATNDSDQAARAHLAQLGLSDQFDFIAGADSGFGAKPDPGMCAGFATHVGLPADRILMVGDSLHDLKAGRAAGMKTVGVLTGFAGRAELAPFADFILQDIGGIPDLLDQTTRPETAAL